MQEDKNQKKLEQIEKQTQDTEKTKSKTYSKAYANKKQASIFLILVLFASLISLIGYLVYVPLFTRCNPLDPYPEITALTPAKITEFGGSPSTVQVNLYIRSIPLFDHLNGRFIIDLIVLFKFDRRNMSLDRIGKFKFDNAKIIEQSKPQTKIDGHNLIVRYDMKIEINSTLNFKYFPIDDHRLDISLTNYTLTPSEIIFRASIEDLNLNPDIKLAGWNIINKKVKTGFLTDKTYKNTKNEDIIYNPRVIFSIEFGCAGLRLVIALLIPLLIIFLISTITLSFNPDKELNTTVSIATITALIAYKFVIENMSPKTGYLIMSDLFFLYIFFGCISIFILNLIASQIDAKYKNIILIFLYFTYAILFFYTLNSIVA